MFNGFYKTTLLGFFLFFLFCSSSFTQNLITNGTFDDGTKGWKVENNSTTTAINILTDAGNKYVQLHHDNVGPRNAIGQEILSKLTIGSTYIFSCRYKADKGIVSTTVHFAFTDASLSSPVTDMNNGWVQVDSTGVWNTFHSTFTVTNAYPRNDEPMIGIIFDYTNQGNLYVDDVSITQSTVNNNITILQPKGGEVKGAISLNISWNYDSTKVVKLDYTSDNGKSWNNISNSKDSLHYEWHMPNNLNSDSCRIRITDDLNTSITAISNLFSVIGWMKIKLIQPKGGENWYAGTTQRIKFYIGPNNSIFYPYIKFSTNNGKNWLSGDYILTDSNNCCPEYDEGNWNIPSNITSDQCKLIVFANNSISDTSNVFSINSTFTPPTFPVTLTIPSNGEITYFPTDSTKCYSIVITGTYSMWKRNPADSCYGLDAAYIYEDSKNDEDTYNWPKNIGYPLWVGLPQTYTINKVMDVDILKHVGFRINDQPVNSPGTFQKTSHRYEYQISNPHSPLKFQILDSAKDLKTNTVIPKYNDNCGNLQVVIDFYKCPSDSQPPSPPICNLGIIYDKADSNNPVGIELKAAFWVLDKNSITGYSNVLKTTSETNFCKKLGINLNGYFVCPIDSVRCKTDTNSKQSGGNVSIGLLIDQSGSMNNKITSSSPDIRIDASKKSVKNFISILDTNNKVFIMSFDTVTYLKQDWTSDKSLLNNAVDNITAYDLTSVYSSILTAREKVLQSKANKKALVVLSDGVDSDPNSFDNSHIIDTINQNSIPIYVIALGFDDSSPEDSIGRVRLGLIATRSGGKLYSVYDAHALDSIYKNLAQVITNEDCCSIFFHDPCLCEKTPPFKERYIKLIYSPEDTVMVTTIIKYQCTKPGRYDCLNGQGVNDIIQSTNVNIFPNPINHQGSLSINIDKPATVTVSITDMLGNIIMADKKLYTESGEYNYLIDGSTIPGGTYFATIVIDGVPISRKIVVVH